MIRNVLLATSVASLGVVSVTSASPEVTMGSATIVGTATAFRPTSPTANAYLGIPFAKPPTRFMPPVPADAFTGRIDATHWPAGCIQQAPGCMCYIEAKQNELH